MGLIRINSNFELQNRKKNNQENERCIRGKEKENIIFWSKITQNQL